VRAICGLLRAQSGHIVKDSADIGPFSAHDSVQHRIAVVLETVACSAS
jgi:ABC-type branched-subunit amino acid transport system ATPase component